VHSLGTGDACGKVVQMSRFVNNATVLIMYNPNYMTYPKKVRSLGYGFDTYLNTSLVAS